MIVARADLVNVHQFLGGVCNAYAATEAGRAMANASPNARSQSSRASAYRIDRNSVTGIRHGG
jgi:hypothetical protein